MPGVLSPVVICHRSHGTALLCEELRFQECSSVVLMMRSSLFYWRKVFVKHVPSSSTLEGFKRFTNLTVEELILSFLLPLFGLNHEGLLQVLPTHK